MRSVAIAEERKCAVGAFNTPNLECLIAVIDAAEKLGTPVIISHAELHENISPLEKIGPVMVQAAEKAGVPVCVQLDHGETLDYIERSLEIGFTGIMYDGSLLPYEENLMNTKKAVAMARSFNAGVEAELGAMPSREGGEAASGPVYTDPVQAEKFCRETGIDALAPSFGTAHGIYKAKPMLDFERVRIISEKTGLPLVMHGGSGVSEDDFRRAIKAGIRKIPQDQLLHLHVQCGKPGGPGTSRKGRCDFLPRSRICGAESNAGGCGEGDDCVYGSQRMRNQTKESE